MTALLLFGACKKDDGTDTDPVDYKPADGVRTDRPDGWDQDNPERTYILSEMGVIVGDKAHHVYMGGGTHHPHVSRDHFETRFPQFTGVKIHVMTMQAPGLFSKGENHGVPVTSRTDANENPDVYMFSFTEDLPGDTLQTDALLIGNKTFNAPPQFDSIAYETWFRVVSDIYDGEWTLIAARPGGLGYCTDGTPIQKISVAVDDRYFEDDTLRHYNVLQVIGNGYREEENYFGNTAVWRGGITDTMRINFLEIESNRWIRRDGPGWGYMLRRDGTF